LLLSDSATRLSQASLENTGQDWLSILVTFTGLQIQPISTWWLLQPKPVIETTIHPFKALCFHATRGFQLDLCQRAHLTVDVGVAEEQLLAFPAIHVAIVIPVCTEGLLGLCHEAPLKA